MPHTHLANSLSRLHVCTREWHYFMSLLMWADPPSLFFWIYRSIYRHAFSLGTHPKILHKGKILFWGLTSERNIFWLPTKIFEFWGWSLRSVQMLSMRGATSVGLCSKNCLKVIYALSMFLNPTLSTTCIITNLHIINFFNGFIVSCMIHLFHKA